jgi:hypothetical protein
MNLKLSNQTIELDTQKLTEEDKKKLIEALEDNTWPKQGDAYYYLDNNGDVRNTRYSYSWNVDPQRVSIGNCFRTRQEVQKHQTYLKALQVLKGDTKGYEWKLGDEFYSPYYDGKNIRVDVGYTAVSGEPVKFKTRKDAEESIKLHEKEWRIVLLGEDK